MLASCRSEAAFGGVQYPVAFGLGDRAGLSMSHALFIVSVALGDGMSPTEPFLPPLDTR
jgi:hypothetical protein